MNKLRLKQDLTTDEGYKKKPYRDTVGKLTIGVGRNLDDVGLRPDEIDLLLENDIQNAVNTLTNNCPWFPQLNDARQEVLINMCFNMGWSSLSQFKNTLDAVRRGDYEKAAQGMEASLWYKQVGARAQRLVARMRSGI